MTEPTEKAPPSTSFILSMMALQTAGFVALGLLIWWWTGRSISQFVTVSTDQIIWGAALGTVFTAIGAAVFYGLPKVSEYLVKAQAGSVDFLEGKLGFGAIVFISICAGIGEEALFRGGIQTILSDYLNGPLAVVLASAAFAALHLSKPLIMFLQFLIGCAFGFAYLHSGSLLAVMLGHGLYDIFALWYVQRELHRLGVFTAAESDFESDPGGETP